MNNGSTRNIHWQLSPDAGSLDAGRFYEGDGFDALSAKLHDIILSESAPEGFIPSGNIAIYWNEIQPARAEA